jgi:hypothetical protein
MAPRNLVDWMCMDEAKPGELWVMICDPTLNGQPDAEAPWGRLRIACENSYVLARDILQDYLAYRNPETPLPQEITVEIYSAPASEEDWYDPKHRISSTSIPKCLFDAIKLL